MVLWSPPDKRYIFSFCLLQILFCFQPNNGTFWRDAHISGFGFTLYLLKPSSEKPLSPVHWGKRHCALLSNIGAVRIKNRRVSGDWSETSSQGRQMGWGEIKTRSGKGGGWSRFIILSGAIQCLSFCVQLTSLSIMSSSFIHVVTNNRISFIKRLNKELSPKRKHVYFISGLRTHLSWTV